MRKTFYVFCIWNFNGVLRKHHNENTTSQNLSKTNTCVKPFWELTIQLLLWSIFHWFLKKWMKIRQWYEIRLCDLVHETWLVSTIAFPLYITKKIIHKKFLSHVGFQLWYFDLNVQLFKVKMLGTLQGTALIKLVEKEET